MIFFFFFLFIIISLTLYGGFLEENVYHNFFFSWKQEYLIFNFFFLEFKNFVIFFYTFCFFSKKSCRINFHLKKSMGISRKYKNTFKINLWTKKKNLWMSKNFFFHKFLFLQFFFFFSWLKNEVIFIYTSER